jgi:hypothetical protein
MRYLTLLCTTGPPTNIGHQILSIENVASAQATPGPALDST